MNASRALYCPILRKNRRNEGYRVDIHVSFTLIPQSLKTGHYASQECNICHWDPPFRLLFQKANQLMRNLASQSSSKTKQILSNMKTRNRVCQCFIAA
jgi:hypothetical protein